MHKTIVICTGKFSLVGFWYYWSHKKMFTKRSFATLLTTVTKGLTTKSISVATRCALSQNVWVERNGLTLQANPETELKEGDNVIFWMVMGNIHYKVQSNQLLLTK